jgi:hypothetical protein
MSRRAAVDGLTRDGTVVLQLPVDALPTPIGELSLRCTTALNRSWRVAGSALGTGGRTGHTSSAWGFWPHFARNSALTCFRRSEKITLANSKNWRRERDSNPRWAFDPYTLSRGAPSTTRPSLRRAQMIRTSPGAGKANDRAAQPIAVTAVSLPFSAGSSFSWRIRS